MNGLIVQEAKIFDPRTVPGYIGELKKWRDAIATKVVAQTEPYKERQTYANLDKTKLIENIQLPFDEGTNPQNSIQPRISETLSKEEFDSIVNGEHIGAFLYSHTLAYLQKLNISSISNLKGRFNNEKMPAGIENLHGLENNINAIAYTWPEFDAVINPPVAVGTKYAKIEMYWSSFDDYEDNPRSIGIAAKFDDPNSARAGLRDLMILFPEMLFEEELLAVKLSTEIMECIENSLDYLNASYARKHGFGPKPDYEFDLDTFHALRKNANLRQLQYLAPYLQSLGVIPNTASYSDSTNLDYNIAVENFYDVADIVADKSYDNLHIPKVSATFKDKKIDMDFNIGNGTFRIFDFGVVIENKDQEGTLEDILEKA